MVVMIPIAPCAPSYHSSISPYPHALKLINVHACPFCLQVPCQPGDTEDTSTSISGVNLDIAAFDVLEDEHEEGTVSHHLPLSDHNANKAGVGALSGSRGEREEKGGVDSVMLGSTSSGSNNASALGWFSEEGSTQTGIPAHWPGSDHQLPKLGYGAQGDGDEGGGCAVGMGSRKLEALKAALLASLPGLLPTSAMDAVDNLCCYAGALEKDRVSKLPVVTDIAQGVVVEEPETPLWPIRHEAAARGSDVSDINSDRMGGADGWSGEEVDGWSGGEVDGWSGGKVDGWSWGEAEGCFTAEHGAGSGATNDSSCHLIVSEQHLDDQVLAREDGAGGEAGRGSGYPAAIATRKPGIGEGMLGAPPVIVGGALLGCCRVCVGLTRAMVRAVAGSLKENLGC